MKITIEITSASTATELTEAAAMLSVIGACRTGRKPDIQQLKPESLHPVGTGSRSNSEGLYPFTESVASTDDLMPIHENPLANAAEAPTAPEEKPARTRKAKTAPAPAAEKEEQPVEVPNKEQNDSEEATPSVTLDMLRAAMSEKSQTHRDALKAEFKKHGVSTVSLLPSEVWDEFYQFVKSL